MSRNHLLVIVLVAGALLSTAGHAQDLDISKVLMPGPDYLGSIIEFEILITNESEAVAQGVVVEEDLPEGLALVEVTTSAGSYDRSLDLWFVGDLDPGQAETLSVRTVRLVEAPLTNCVFAQYMTGGGDQASSAVACAMVEPSITPPTDLVTYRD